MYTVLLVDDEPIVRRGISRVINWESLGFTTVYEAEDGAQAFEIIKKHAVDLLITDIVMPYIDGIELAQMVSKEFPKTQIVILTGHEDFEYAKKSIDFGVKNYILKPVGADTLYEKIKKICEKLQFETWQQQYMKNMQKQLNESKPIIQEKILYTLVCTERYTTKDIQNKIRELDIPLGEGPFAVGVIEPDLQNMDNHELFYLAAKNLAKESVGKFACVFDDNKNQILLVFNGKQFAGSDPLDVSYNTLQVIQKSIHSTLKTDVSCGQGGLVNKLEELNQSYQEAVNALECKHSLGANRVYGIKDLGYLHKAFYYPAQYIEDLLYAIKFEESVKIAECFEVIHKDLITHKLSTTNTKMVCVEIVTILLKQLSSLKLQDEKLGQIGFLIYKTIGEMKSLESVLEEIQEFAEYVHDQLFMAQNRSSWELIERVKQYVLDNYMLPELSLAMAAENVAVSTGYLSALFKKETGTNFIKYLTAIRMDKAQELLVRTDMRTYEIAHETGFANPHYFSITFKKNVGISPSEFRQAKEE